MIDTITIVVLGIFGFGLGSIFGSFLNVVALRWNTGKSLNGRSECFSCGHMLGWKDLFPIFSFVFQGGRCRYCSSHISWDHLYSESLTAILFAVIVLRGVIDPALFSTGNYWIATLFLLVITAVLVVVFLYDIRHKIIPDELSLVFAVLAFVGMFFFGFGDAGVFIAHAFTVPSWEHVVGGLLVPLPFAVLWLVSKGRWIGLGDPKLMVGMGFLFGSIQGLSAVFLSFWIATLYIMTLVIVRFLGSRKLFAYSKHTIMGTEVPFGPFLILSCVIVLVTNFSFLSFL